MLDIRYSHVPRDMQEPTRLWYDVYDAVCSYPKDSRTWTARTSIATRPQLVSRQYWAETSQVFLSSLTLRVDTPSDFRAFARSDDSLVHQIRRLIVHVSGSKSNNFPRHWQEVFNASSVGRLASLEGLRFSGRVYWGTGRPAGVRDTNVMHGNHWKLCKLPNTVRSFQQHKLKPELTSVTFKPVVTRVEGPWDAKPINKAIRENLLQYHPRRLSQRGS
jgi:hypothetical protein